MLFFALNIQFDKKKVFFKANFKYFYPFLGIFAALRPSFKYFNHFFRGSEVCLERCDSYNNFGYLKEYQTFLFLQKFVREHIVLLLKPWLCSYS